MNKFILLFVAIWFLFLLSGCIDTNIFPKYCQSDEDCKQSDCTFRPYIFFGNLRGKPNALCKCDLKTNSCKYSEAAVLNCSDFNGEICNPNQICSGIQIPAHDTEDCCVTEECQPIDWTECETDSDCVKVPTNCCRFDWTTINKKYEKEWQMQFPGDCVCPAMIPQPNINSFAKPKCIESECVLDLKDSSACDNTLCYFIFAVENKDLNLCDKITVEGKYQPASKQQCKECVAASIKCDPYAILGIK